MGHHRARVLVVDDDADVRSLLQDLLERKGFEPTVACDGGEAIEILESGACFSAILADLVMPGIIGNELLEYLQSDETLAAIPVAIITGSPHLAPPGYQVFQKPAPATELMEFVRSSCHAVRSVHEDSERTARHAVR